MKTSLLFVSVAAVTMFAVSSASQAGSRSEGARTGCAITKMMGRWSRSARSSVATTTTRTRRASWFSSRTRSTRTRSKSR